MIQAIKICKTKTTLNKISSSQASSVSKYLKGSITKSTKFWLLISVTPLRLAYNRTTSLNIWLPQTLVSKFRYSLTDWSITSFLKNKSKTSKAVLSRSSTSGQTTDTLLMTKTGSSSWNQSYNFLTSLSPMSSKWQMLWSKTNNMQEDSLNFCSAVVSKVWNQQLLKT